MCRLYAHVHVSLPSQIWQYRKTLQQLVMNSFTSELLWEPHLASFDEWIPYLALGKREEGGREREKGKERRKERGREGRREEGMKKEEGEGG